MRVVIIGSTGQLAHDLLKVFGADAVGLTHEQLEVTDDANVVRILHTLKPDWVLNTAAFLRVDDCEAEAARAFAVNAVGALNVARAALTVGAGVVYFSTDYAILGGDVMLIDEINSLPERLQDFPSCPGPVCRTRRRLARHGVVVGDGCSQPPYRLRAASPHLRPCLRVTPEQSASETVRGRIRQFC
jgi:nucleoside-diphosphate-sugar epimerase